MSKRAEKMLISWLIDTESVQTLVREGLDIEALPTADLRPLVPWAAEHLSRTGKAPAKQTMLDRWPEQINQFEIALDDEPEEPIEWCIDELRDSYVDLVSQKLSLQLAQECSGAAPGTRVEVFTRMAGEIITAAAAFQPHTSHVDMRQSAKDMLAEYDRVAALGSPVRGMTFGLPEIDEVTLGIWPSELCVLAAPPKTGKSWMSTFVAYNEWKSERPVALYTLENSIEMTLLRIACVALHLSISQLQSGKLSPEHYDMLKTWVHDTMGSSDVPLHIMNPESGLRTAGAIVEQTRAYGCKGLIVDQLSHMETAGSNKNWSRTNEIWNIVAGLKTGISTGRQHLPCLLIHQINREGEEYLEKHGRLLKRHAAESSAVEKNADLMLALHASDDERMHEEATLDVVAVRRIAEGGRWKLNWNIDVGRVGVISYEEAA
jgi:replicative DNA helicase